MYILLMYFPLHPPKSGGVIRSSSVQSELSFFFVYNNLSKISQQVISVQVYTLQCEW